MPGDSERKIAKARESGADAIILDLEDSIVPDSKENARQIVTQILRDSDFGKKRVFVRINGIKTRFALDDARAVASTGKAGILIPKTEHVDEVTTIAPIIASYSRAPEKTNRILCLIESPTGVLEARSIASASPLVAGLIFGSADLVRETGSILTDGEPELHYSRSHVLLAARASGVSAYDSPHFVIADIDGLLRSSQLVRNLGYDGRTIIHPDHIDTVNRVFSPQPEEIEQARRIVHALEQAAAEGRGAVALDGRLIDQVHLANARKLLAQVDEMAS